ncbi:RagB/SusD family nutrient uptake outer membrane protein [Candidatus Symbiothrix dinenymphae]|uniref:RagB/SusD family nutrient uptake outer membrane protein n=1 Tax=Candidatus Symbiothrix dinenymphae TaxID=467085 RepID=UPI0006C4D89B|nr:RagB/SusD family nutrient uptake outer membrane protein [Candidatus Symbiothrix dinenymphae]GAP72918.1 RagB/SusD domain-containing protein [Candidatus Symbiothrix dinenymphae]
MKTIIKCITAAMFIFPSCDYLDVVPDMVPTLDNAFSDRYMAEKFLATCYYGLPSTASLTATPGFLGALEMIYNKDYKEPDERTNPGMVLGLGQNDRTTAIMDMWAGGTPGSLYATIRDCNTFLDNIERVPDLKRPEKDRWIAEVKLVKAYCHFSLITHYGPMCIVRESAPVSTSTQGVRVYRDKVDDCFAYTVELLDEAINSNALPEIIPDIGKESGRFTKAAAYAIKAKVLVYWASPLFNGNTELVNFVDHNNEPFFNQTEDPTRWTKAAEACKAAVAVCGDARIRLFQRADYTTPFTLSDTTALVNTLREAICKLWNVELIWTNNAATFTVFQANCMPRLELAVSNPAKGLFSIPFSTVDVFYTKDGVPINETDSFDYDGRFNIRQGDYDHRYLIQMGEWTAAMNFDREPRFYSTLGFDRGKWYGNHDQNPPGGAGGAPGLEVDSRYPRARYGEYSSIFAPGEYNATGYWPKKLIHPNTQYSNNSTTWWGEIYPFPSMRYADLLLLTAEAVNEAEGPTNAYPYIDEVRARAGLVGVVNSWQTHAKSAYKSKPTTPIGLRAIIQQERKIELACEGHYFWDSRRWKTAATEQNNRLIQGWNHLGRSANDYYTPTTIYTQRFISPRDYFFPIPESDCIDNPQLKQNRGW